MKGAVFLGFRPGERGAMGGTLTVHRRHESRHSARLLTPSRQTGTLREQTLCVTDMKKDLWQCRMEDLEPGDTINVMCRRCGHGAMLDAEMIKKRIKPKGQSKHWSPLAMDTRVLDLKGYLSCTKCPRNPKTGRKHHDIAVRVIDRTWTALGGKGIPQS